VGVEAPESWCAGIGRDAAVVMVVDCLSCDVVIVVLRSVRARKGESAEVILLMVTRQLIVMRPNSLSREIESWM
jgi:hypothetical protein